MVRCDNSLIEQSEAEGRIHTFLSTRHITPKTRFVKLPNQIPTEVATASTSIYAATKRGQVYRYSLPTLRPIGKPFGQDVSPQKGKASAGTTAIGHKGEILCVAASEDGRYIVTGGRDKLVGVWEVDGEEVKWVAGMRGHKDAVTVSDCRASTFLLSFGFQLTCGRASPSHH